MTVELVLRIWATYTVVAVLALLMGDALSRNENDSIGVADVCFAFCCTWPFATAAAAVEVIWLL